MSIILSMSIMSILFCRYFLFIYMLPMRLNDFCVDICSLLQQVWECFFRKTLLPSDKKRLALFKLSKLEGSPDDVITCFWGLSLHFFLFSICFISSKFVALRILHTCKSDLAIEPVSQLFNLFVVSLNRMKRKIYQHFIHLIAMRKLRASQIIL